MANNKSTKKKEDDTFHSRHIKHDPQAESARAKFGFADKTLNSKKEDEK